MDYRSCLESSRGLKTSRGSNPLPSAIIHHKGIKMLKEIIKEGDFEISVDSLEVLVDRVVKEIKELYSPEEIENEVSIDACNDALYEAEFPGHFIDPLLGLIFEKAFERLGITE